MTFFEKIKRFFGEVRIELGKVVWPTRQETIRYTAAVVVLSLVMAIFLGGLDSIFQYLFRIAFLR